MSQLRVVSLITVALISFLVLGGISISRSVGVAAAGQPYSFNFLGTPASPQSVVPATWDVQIHKRDPGDSMEPMDAGHGTDCGAPPATHPINTLAQGLFICKNHLMTAMVDSGYGEIALTPDHMADWSTGTVTIKFDVSTLQFNSSDFVEIWVSPFADNQTLPFEDDIIDNQGPIKNALIFSVNASGLIGTREGHVSRLDNFVQKDLPQNLCNFAGEPTCLPQLLAPSGAIRTTYEIDISQGHVRFGLPAYNVWYTDTNIAPLSFSQGLVQITHHSYNPIKHDPGTGIDTWHWSNFSISNAVPFAIINGAERSINAGGATTVHFPAPAPANAYLRFSGLGPIGKTYTVSYDGGTTWVSPALQNQIGPIHDEHFSTYWTPVPAGTQAVMFRGVDWWGGPWWVRDPAFWAEGSVTPPLPTAPAVTALAPNNGPIAGGTSVTITGTNFSGANAVNFGTVAAATFTVASATQIMATSPAGSGTVDVTVTTPGGTSATSAADQFTFVAPPSVYTAITPTRLLDTRGNGGRLGPGRSVILTIGGAGIVPANATAVILNVTAVGESTAGFFTVYPTGGSLPTASNLNWVAGETVPNLVAVGLGNSGDVTIYNGLGSADAVVDLQGYFAPSAGGSAGQYVPVVPARITDTRSGSGQANAGIKLGPGATLNVQVTGVGPIPAASGVSAVVLNVTATGTTSAGFFTVFPTGALLPVASNLNWTAGVTVPNRVIVPVGTSGQVSIFNGLGSADVVIDVNGYFTTTALAGAVFTPLFPARILDTRFGSPLAAGLANKLVLQVGGNGGVPSNASAAILNVTVARPTTASDLVIWPDLAGMPVASDLNFVGGQTVPNLVIVKLSAGGKIDIFNPFGTTDVIVDVVGWFG